MRLLLREPVRALGEPGDEVKVRAGYARNYLLPRGIAVPVTEENRREVAEARKTWAVRRIKEREAAAAVAETLEGQVLSFERRAKTDSDELYGSVSVQDIARDLAAEGFRISRGRILLSSPIKNLGTHEVSIRLHPEIEVSVRIEVTSVAASAFGMEPEPPAVPPTQHVQEGAVGMPAVGDEGSEAEETAQEY